MSYIASCSFGKDSLAMVLLLIEKHYPLDEVVFYDTGMEFDAIYNNRNKLVFILNQLGITYTELHPEIPFTEKMFDIFVKERTGGGFHHGYSWCGGRCRWGTTDNYPDIIQHGDAFVVREGSWKPPQTRSEWLDELLEVSG